LHYREYTYHIEENIHRLTRHNEIIVKTRIFESAFPNLSNVALIYFKLISFSIICNILQVNNKNKQSILPKAIDHETENGKSAD